MFCFYAPGADLSLSRLSLDWHEKTAIGKHHQAPAETLAFYLTQDSHDRKNDVRSNVGFVDFTLRYLSDSSHLIVARGQVGSLIWTEPKRNLINVERSVFNCINCFQLHKNYAHPTNSYLFRGIFCHIGNRMACINSPHSPIFIG